MTDRIEYGRIPDFVMSNPHLSAKTKVTFAMLDMLSGNTGEITVNVAEQLHKVFPESPDYEVFDSETVA